VIFFLKIAGYPISNARDYIFRKCKTRKFNSLYLDDLKWEIFNFHLKSNDFYQEFIKQFIINDDWTRIPVITKKDFQFPIKDLLSDKFKVANVYKANTSGSSGHPFFFAKDKFSHALSYALMEERYGRHKLNVFSRQARFFGIPLKGKSKYIELLKDLLGNRVRFPVFDLSDTNLDKYLLKFQKVKFNYVYGYSSAILIFAKFLQRKRIVLKDICPTLTLCIVTADVCTDIDKNIIESAFGVRVLNEYGCSEISIIAFPDEDGDWILSDEALYIEILDENDCLLPDGQEGRIVITSLFNKAMPFIRYDIGDIGAIERKGKSKLLRLVGRTNDIIKLPSGKKAAGLTFYYISRSILESKGILKEFIIKQTKLDEFVFEIVSDRDLTFQEINMVHDQMDLYLEKGLKL
jgi:phenylacetate-CoA ligase